ncbi:MAG TPA: hypothetical protein VNO21_25405, partial [Polyangiaceae bacterium]|nr:hypothetical protein [Polyangiaceae bacterium]
SRPPSEQSGARVLDAVPDDTFLLATVDVARVRSSPLAEPLRSLGAGMERNIAGQCGFDPVDRLDTLALAVPESDGIGDFGVATVGHLQKEELVRCARTIMQGRSAALGTREASDFTIVEDKGTFAAGAAKLAIRDLGPFLLAREPWLSNMMAAWEGKKPRIAANPRHMELRRALAGSASDQVADKGQHADPAVMVTALLPAKLRDRLKREMSANPADASNTAMLGILSVDAAGMALSLTPDGLIDLRAELRCETADACAQVQEFLAKKRGELAGDFRMRLLGLGGLLQGLTVETKETRISARARLPADEAKRLLDRLLELRSGAGVTKSAPPDKDAGPR